MYLKIDNKKYKVVQADSFFKRLFGLMFKKNINYIMFFPKCNSIHTFFMREPIDIIGIDYNNKVIYKEMNVKSNRIIFIKHKKTSILELPNNTSLNINIKDTLIFENEDIV